MDSVATPVSRTGADTSARQGRPRARHRRPPRRRRLSGRACAALAAVGVLAAGLVAGTALTKEVRVSVDGDEFTVRGFPETVAEALAAADVATRPGDHVSPPPTAPVRDGSTIVVRRARPLTVTKDGETRTYQVTALNVADALRELRLDRGRIRLSASAMRHIPISGFSLTVQTERRVTIVKGGMRLDTITTARTVRELLAEERLTLEPGDRVRPGLDRFPREGQVIRIVPRAAARSGAAPSRTGAARSGAGAARSGSAPVGSVGRVVP